MKKAVFLFLMLTTFLSASAFDFTTKSGKEYRNAGIGKAEIDGLEIILPSGVEIIPLEEISDDLMNRLSESRRTRILKLLEEKKKQAKKPSKEKTKEKAPASPETNGNAAAIARMAEQQMDGVRRWLTVFHITRNPSAEAKRFSALCEEFVREMDRASTDSQKAEAYLEFQKKVQEGNFSGSLQLRPTQGPMRSYIQNPESSSGTTTEKEKIYLGPRGARYYKNNGRLVPIRRTN